VANSSKTVDWPFYGIFRERRYYDNIICSSYHQSATKIVMSIYYIECGLASPDYYTISDSKGRQTFCPTTDTIFLLQIKYFTNNWICRLVVLYCNMGWMIFYFISIRFSRVCSLSAVHLSYIFYYNRKEKISKCWTSLTDFRIVQKIVVFYFLFINLNAVKKQKSDPYIYFYYFF